MDKFDLQDPLTSLDGHQSDSISALFSSESDHMPSYNYFQCLKTSDFHVSFRQEAISLILQVSHTVFFFFFLLMLFTILVFYFLAFCCKLVLVCQAQYSSNLDPYTQYLAVNYMDRFISWQEIPVCFNEAK